MQYVPTKFRLYSGGRAHHGGWTDKSIQSGLFSIIIDSRRNGLRCLALSGLYNITIFIIESSKNLKDLNLNLHQISLFPKNSRKLLGA